MATTWRDLASANNGLALIAADYTPAVTGISTTGGTLTVRAAGGPFGSRQHVEEVGTSGKSGAAGMYVTIPASDQVAGAREVAIIAYPTGETGILSFTKAGVRQVGVTMTPLGELRVYDKDAAPHWNGTATKSPALPLNVPMQISLYALRSLTSGAYRVIVHNLNTGGVIADSGLQVGLNTGDQAITGVWSGVKASANTTAGAFDAAGFAVDPVATEPIPPRLPVVESPSAVANADAAYRMVNASSSTPGSGGTLSFSISPSAGVFDVGGGKFLVPAPLSAQNYTVTVTEAPSGKVDTTVVSVAPAGSDGGVDSFWDGSNWRQ